MSGGSWYDANFLYRYPIAIDGSSTGSGSSGTYEVQIVVPEKWSAFWDVIQSSGHDVYLVSKDCTLLEYKRTTFNYANKSLTLNARNVSSSSLNKVQTIYIYWGYASAADGVSVFTPAGTPLSGQIYLGKPNNMVVSNPKNMRGGEAPSSAFSKPVHQSGYIWFNYGSIMAKRLSPYNKSLGLEGVDYIEPFVLDSSGSTQATMIDQNKTRILPGYIGIFIQAGTDNQDYLAVCNFQTTENQIYSLRCVLSIRNQLPPAR